MVSPNSSEASFETYTPPTPLDKYPDEWKVAVVDKIWASCMIVPENTSDPEIVNEIAEHLNHEYGTLHPETYIRADGVEVTDERKKVNITGGEITMMIFYLKGGVRGEDYNWFTERIKRMRREWDGEEMPEGGGWKKRPRKAETKYILATIREVSTGQARKNMMYRQFKWSTQRKRTLCLREASRRSGFYEHPVYKTLEDNWRFRGPRNPTQSSGPLSQDEEKEMKEIDKMLEDAGVTWEFADDDELEGSYQLA